MMQRIIVLVALIGGVALGLGSCSIEPARPAFDAQLARSVNDAATTAAVARAGAKVCRQTEIGIAERDWLRGVVTEVAADAITVRIEQPGRFPQSLNGTSMARGVTVRDSANAWTPCRF
jgi:isopentenyl diphosphate isomerase/L-lactate dehydrogenase-like FMN-dependent dehydrogenase